MKKILMAVFFVSLALFIIIPNSIADIIYHHNDSRVDINLDISDLGGGTYGYTFSFINRESSELWDFAVWTIEPVSTLSGSFERNVSIHLDQVFSEFDARNLDSSLSWLNGMYYPSNRFQTAPDSGLPIDDSAFLYFEANFFETSFHYGYQTLDSGHASSNGGFFAAGGVASATAVPIPSAVWLLGCGLIGVVGFRKKVSNRPVY